MIKPDEQYVLENMLLAIIDQAKFLKNILVRGDVEEHQFFNKYIKELKELTQKLPND